MRVRKVFEWFSGCVSCSVFSAFLFRSFVQVLYVCIYVVSMFLPTRLLNEDLQSDKKPDFCAWDR